MLLSQGKHSDYAFNRFRSIRSVQSREHKMAGLGCLQRDFDRLLISHLANQDYLWGLSQGRSQCECKVRGIAVQLSLMNNGTLVTVHEFDRIFNRKYVIRLGVVDAVENRRQS